VVGSPRLRRPLRRILSTLLVVIVVAAVGAVGTDTAIAINAERSFAKALMSSRAYDGESPALRFEPEVTISGFPAYRAVDTGRFRQIGITARAVDVTGRATFPNDKQRRMPHGCTAGDPCRADVRTRLSDVRLGATGLWPSYTEATGLSVGSATASTTLDSVAVGRILGIDDLTVNTPAPEGRAGGGGPQDGLLSRTRGVLLTGTVRTPLPDGREVKVSVTVDLSVREGRLHLQATGFYDGPEEHSGTVVPPEYRQSVLDRFTATFPSLPMAWGATPISARSSGSDLMVEGTPHPQVYTFGLFLDAQGVYMMWKR
jgi:hypothetical protein